MASKPLRLCRYPGCSALTKDGYCPDHKPIRAARKESAAWHWMYSEPIWVDDLRPGQLMEEPFCRECARNGRRVRATVVDHVKAHKGDWSLFTDRSNLQSLCKWCHDRKTMAEMHAERRRKQVVF